MKLALATLFFAAPAAAFAPSASFGVNTALKMSTEAATEKVRKYSKDFFVIIALTQERNDECQKWEHDGDHRYN